MTDLVAADVRRTKNSIIIYILLTAALSSVFYLLVIHRSSAGRSPGLLILGLMWCPGVSGLLTRLAFQGNLHHHGLGWGKAKYQFASYWIPLAYSSIVYFPFWLAGYFDPNNRTLDGLTHRLPDLPHPAALPVLFLFLATVGMVGSCFSALGEELGWRGFLVPQLAKVTSYPRVALISGAIWTLWHYPIILFAGYHGAGPLWYSVMCFTVMVLGISFLFAWMRLKSGSVWDRRASARQPQSLRAGLFRRRRAAPASPTCGPPNSAQARAHRPRRRHYFLCQARRTPGATQVRIRTANFIHLSCRRLEVLQARVDCIACMEVSRGAECCNTPISNVRPRTGVCPWIALALSYTRRHEPAVRSEEMIDVVSGHMTYEIAHRQAHSICAALESQCA